MTEELTHIKEATPDSPGAMLTRLRVERDLSLAEVAQRLKYGQRQIEALERDDFSKLPGMTFVRGMIRGYARLLGADPEVILCELDRRRSPDPLVVDFRVSQIPFPDGKKRTTRVYAALSAMLIVIAVLIGYEVSPWQSESYVDIQHSTPLPAQHAAPVDRTLAITPAPELPPLPDNASLSDAASTLQKTASAEPVISVPAPATAPSSLAGKGISSGSKRIALQFDRESWVEIRQANGKTLLSQLNPGGSRQIVEGIPPFILIIGNAPNVHLSYNDQPVDLRPHFKVDVARLTLE